MLRPGALGERLLGESRSRTGGARSSVPRDFSSSFARSSESLYSGSGVTRVAVASIVFLLARAVHSWCVASTQGPLTSGGSPVGPAARARHPARGRHGLLEQSQYGAESLGADLPRGVSRVQEGAVQREAVDLARHELGQRRAADPCRPCLRGRGETGPPARRGTAAAGRAPARRGRGAGADTAAARSAPPAAGARGPTSAHRAADDSASAARSPRWACAGGASASIMRPVTCSSTATSSASLLPNRECSVARLTPASPASLRVVMAATPSRAMAR